MLQFSDTRRHISEIPHPSITICPELEVTAEGFDFYQIILNLENQKILSVQELVL
jgi:hypothetical protein